MKLLRPLLVSAVAALAFTATESRAQVTAFTYQGRLNAEGGPANGVYDFMFRLMTDVTAGTAAPTIPLNPAVGVTNGLFTTGVDFGAQALNGAALWLEISVRTNGGGSFTTLAPRQLLTSAPFATKALSATSLSGTLPASQVSGDGSAIGNLNAASLASGVIPLPRIAGLTAAQIDAATWQLATNRNGGDAASLGGQAVSNFWGTAGNNVASGQFLGSTNNQPLELRVNARRVVRYEAATNSPSQSNGVNIVAGSPNNLVGSGVFGATIAGGGALAYGGVASTNAVFSDFGTIAGGSGIEVRVDSRHSSIGGGQRNVVNGAWHGAILGGSGNDIWTLADGAVIGGGYDNLVDAGSGSSVVSGGQLNEIGTNSSHSVIGGGRFNTIGSSSTNSVVAGGAENLIGTNTSYSAIGGGQQNTIDGAWESTVAGGSANKIQDLADASFLGGGKLNFIGRSSAYAVVAGGRDNFIAPLTTNATIAGGFFNTVEGNAGNASVGGGNGNTVTTNGQFAIIPGGRNNTATNDAFAAGRNAAAIHSGSFVWADSNNANLASTANNSVTLRASGGYRLFSNAGASSGVSLAANGTSWSVISDRNQKKDFTPIDSRDVLEKLAALPITRWHYNWEQPGETPHMGPMAQDFKAAFYPGRDDKSITTLEADGVALAAIQGLNQKHEAEVKSKDARIRELEARMEKLERMMEAKGGGR